MICHYKRGRCRDVLRNIIQLLKLETVLNKNKTPTYIVALAELAQLLPLKIINWASGIALYTVLLLSPGNVYANEVPPNTEDENLAEMSLKDLMELEVFSAATLLPTEQAKVPGTVYTIINI